MTKQRSLPKSKRFYIVSAALVWGITISIFACAIFWKLGALSVMSALALIFVAMVMGFGFAATMYELMKSRFGPARDDD